VSPERIVRNAGVSTVVYIVGSIAGLVLVPILLRTLGATQFGLYVLAQTALSFSSLAGGGLHRGFVRSIVAHRVSVDGSEGLDGAEAVIGTGVTLMLMFGAAVVLGIALLFPLFVRLFGVTEPDVSGFAWILGGATVAYVLGLISTPYQALLIAGGRLDRSKAIEGFSIIAGSTASAAAALAGLGLKGVGIALVVVAVPTATATFFSALRTSAVAAATRPRYDGSIVRELWQFGSRIQLVALAGMINRSVDRASLGILRSPTAVAAYDVSDRAAYSLVYTANTLAEALTPRMAGHLAREDAGAARGTYQMATRIFSVAALTMASFALFHASTILTVWLGTSNTVSAVALMVLASGYGVGVSFSAAHVVATAQAQPTLAMRYSIAQATVNVTLSLLGAWLAGVVGAAVGSALSGAIGAVIFAVLVERRILGTHELPGLRTLGHAALVSLPVAAVLGYATSTVITQSGAGRVGGFALLGVAFGAQICVTVILAVKTRLLPEEAVRDMLSRTVGRLRKRA